MLDGNDKRGITDATLRTLSAIELIFNVSSVFLGIYLFYMIDKMSEKVTDENYDPILKRNVPFFVFLGNCKLVAEHIEKNGGVEA